MTTTSAPSLIARRGRRLAAGVAFGAEVDGERRGGDHRSLLCRYGAAQRVHMGNLRRKLEPDPSRPRYLRTDPGLGYRFMPEEQPGSGRAG